MATLTQAISIISEISHLTEKQIRAISYKFQQLDLFPVSSGRDVKHISEAQFALLILACYVEVPGLKPVASAQYYYDLSDEDSRRAGDAIATALTSGTANAIQIEISDPAVCVVTPDGAQRFGAAPTPTKVAFRVEFGQEVLERTAALWRKAAPAVT
ncbi:hypothetical protein ABNQ39_07230 [Azospirillum sp. A26]|uniref:hypothetical protein n=1 Tax=Azospirillum sp. A26 TaxID=3160607 RepID=UPI003670956B